MGTVSKTGAATTKAALQKSVTTTQNALQSLRTLELPQLLHYTPRLELSLPDGVPVKVVDGNHLKDQLILMAQQKETRGKSEVSSKVFYIAHVKEAKNVIAEKTKWLDLNEHPTKTKQMSSKKMKELKNKVDNRTITKQEYADYIWNKKFAKRRDKGVKEF